MKGVDENRINTNEVSIVITAKKVTNINEISLLHIIPSPF